MKTPKVLTAIIAILLFSNFLFAGSPENTKSYMVEKLCKDIVLTDSQKVIIEAKADIFDAILQSGVPTKDNNDLIQAFRGYKAALDSLLTGAQKEQLIQKHNARRDAATTELKNQNKE